MPRIAGAEIPEAPPEDPFGDGCGALPVCVDGGFPSEVVLGICAVVDARCDTRLVNGMSARKLLQALSVYVTRMG